MMWVRPALAIAAFCIYFIAALCADRPNSWQAEYDMCLPAAVSFAVYGTPMGLADNNVRGAFHRIYRQEGVSPETVHKAVEEVGRGKVALGELFPRADGLGLGQVLFMSLAMKVFGPHLWSIRLGFLLLLGVSTLALAARFRDNRLTVVPIVFLALTLMLLTPLVTDQAVADQVPIGGNRFFPVLGVLPALHLWFELASPSPPGDRRKRLDVALLAVQSAMLVLVILARSSTAYMLGALAVAAALGMIASRGIPPLRQHLYRTLGNAAIVAIAFVSLAIASMPTYLKSGHVLGVFWHRAFISLGVHPAWPFGNLREVHDCRYMIPEGLSAGNRDSNGACIWWAHPPNRARPRSEVNKEEFGPQYEAVLRSTLFDVARAYPWQVFEVYAYYKPMKLLETARRALGLQLLQLPWLVAVLVALQALVFLAYCARSSLQRQTITAAVALPIVLLFALTLPGQMVAWSNLATSADVIFFMYAVLLLASAYVVERVAGSAGLISPGSDRARTCL